MSRTLSFSVFALNSLLLGLYLQVSAKPANGTNLHGMVAAVGPVVLSKNGKVALSANRERLKAWNIGTKRSIQTFKAGGNLYAVALSLDARRAASGGSDKIVRIFDVASGQL